MLAVVIFFVIAVIVDVVIANVAQYRMSKLSNEELHKYKIPHAGTYLHGIYARALKKELHKRYGYGNY
jgi:Fe2+ transport system protein B